jgi:hypothetical protein
VGRLHGGPEVRGGGCCADVAQVQGEPAPATADLDILADPGLHIAG